MEKIEKPDWCKYRDAAVPFWGCWSLLAGNVTGRNFCQTCECYKKE